MTKLREIVADFFDLHSDRAPMHEIIDRINSGSMIKGTNMSILILAIFIASIGLNMNSTAVIIGAMLISPLMGVIMAIGYGLASYNTAYVRSSILKLLFQVFISVLASTIYFKLSPITSASSELLSRTSPNTWDVLIAFFGGLAGVIGITRIEKSNVIPGVAIATALMPPLCTAGYGLAVGSWQYFFGALYLFFINGFFICLSTFIVLKLIHIPIKKYPSVQGLRRQKLYLIAISIIIILPSLYFAYNSVNNNLAHTEAETYIRKNWNFSNLQVVSYSINEKKKTLDVVAIGRNLDQREKTNLTSELKQYPKLKNLHLNIIQNDYSASLNKQDIQSLIENKLQGMDSANRNELKKYKDLSINYYPAYYRFSEDQKIIAALNKKLPIIFPQVVKVEGASIATANAKGEIKMQAFMTIVYVKQEISQRDAQKIKAWIKEECKLPVVLTIEKNDQAATDVILGNGVF